MTVVVDVIGLDRSSQVTREVGHQRWPVVKIGLLFVDAGIIMSSPWRTDRTGEIEDGRSISEHALCTARMEAARLRG